MQPTDLFSLSLMLYYHHHNARNSTLIKILEGWASLYLMTTVIYSASPVRGIYAAAMGKRPSLGLEEKCHCGLGESKLLSSTIKHLSLRTDNIRNGLKSGCFGIFNIHRSLQLSVIPGGLYHWTSLASMSTIL